MRGEDLLRGMNGDPLSPDELDMIDEAIGLDNVRDAAAGQQIQVVRAVEGHRVGMGEDLQRAHDTVLTQPREQPGTERYKLKLPKMKKRPPPKKGGGFANDPRKKVLPVVRSVPVIPDEGVISNFNVSNDKAYRVDVGIDGRTDVLVANMSLSVVWVNFVSNIALGAAYVGVPLRAMSGAAAYDGGVLRLAIQKTKRLWARSVGVGPNLVVTIETAIRE